MAYNIPTRSGRGAGASVPYVPALSDLVLSGALVAGVASSGTILNATPGSAIASNLSGLAVNSAARTYTYNGSGSPGTTAAALTETLAGATYSPRSNAVTIVAGAVPAFTSNPSISPGSGSADATFTGIDGAMNNGGSILGRRWLLNGTAIGTGTTIVPGAAGALVLENTGTGNVVATSASATVSAAAPTPTPTPSLAINGAPSSATVGTGLAFSPSITGGTSPYSLTLASGTLPAGRAIVGNAVQGNYTTAADYSYVLKAPDATGATATLAVSETVAASGQPLNLQRLNALPANWMLATLGASRFRQGSGVGLSSSGYTGGAVYRQSMAFLEHARSETIGFRYPIWFDAGSPDSNFKLNGMCFSNDGDKFSSMLERVDRVLASDADVVLINSSIGSLRQETTPATYGAEFQALISLIISGRNGRVPGKAVVIDNLWERGPNGDSIWAVGGTKQIIPAVNAAMKTWADTNGIPVLDFRSVMTQADANGDVQPIPGLVRTDKTHESPAGAEVMKTVFLNALSPYMKAVTPPDAAASDNLLGTVGTMAGTGGTIGSGFAAGSALATGLTASRGGTGLSTVTISKLNKVPGNSRQGSAALDYVRVAVDPTAMTGTDPDTVTIAVTAPPSVTAGKWYALEVLIEKSAADKVNFIRASTRDGSTTTATQASSHVGWATDDGGGTNNTPLVLPNAAFVRRYRTPPFKALNTGTGQAVVFLSYGASATPFTVDIAAMRLIELTDQTRLLYDEGLPAGTTISTQAEQSFAGDGVTTPVVQLVASKLGYWKLTGGADVSAWTVDGSGKMSRATPFNYGVPDDADADRVDNITATITPFDLRDAPVSLAMNITNTYAYTGFGDSMYRASDVAEELSANANWTKYGTGTQVVQAQAGTATGAATKRGVMRVSSGTGRVFYAAPQQPAGPTHAAEQQISFSQQISSTNYSPTFVVNGKDADNWMGLRIGPAGTLSLYKMEAGTGATLATLNMFAPYNAVSGMTVRRLGDVLYVDQGGVTLGSYDLTAQANFSAQGGYKSWTLGGVATHVSSQVVSQVCKNVVARTATPLPNKEGVPAAVFEATGNTTSPTGTAGNPFAARVTTLTGSTVTIQNIKLNNAVDNSGTLFPDGDQVRMTSAVAGTWTYDVVQTKAGAVYSGRVTSMTTVIN
ncbi:GDSL-like Lipase/Acylhydrolase family protein [Sphingomonas gellani]|uniref:GDSL-like Lipase/Acylhydrolase family protein n=1 Tax=Sphingomonas gellani TaxID=1166340 RepID=A0A1H8H3L9_9SPHN|nr:SGNH/GDSL hydrolase family protein [Sphingomonas gellani]SEN50952.1 GDSL-like Lipase/Acylhydrolase family protein [Sphingomonas gellani]